MLSPPPQGDVDAAMTLLVNTISMIPPDSELFIAGDLNIDLNSKKSSAYNKLLNLTQSSHLKQLIKVPTRITSSTATVIDHITSNSPHITNSGSINVNLSDHLPCFVVRKKARLPKIKVSFKCRKIKHLDIDFLTNRLHKLDWQSFYACTNPNDCWKIYYENILEILDQFYPMTEFKKVRIKSPWLNNELFEKINERD